MTTISISMMVGMRQNSQIGFIQETFNEEKVYKEKVFTRDSAILYGWKHKALLSPLSLKGPSKGIITRAWRQRGQGTER